MTPDPARTIKLSGAPAPDLRRVVDPLGEIEALAKQLHGESQAAPEQPAGEGFERWEEFWVEAERRLTAGKSEGVPSDRTRSAKVDTVPERLRDLAQQSDNLILSLLAGSLPKYLSSHESICLGYVLQTNCFEFKGGSGPVESRLGPFSIPAAAELLTELSDEYDPDFLRACGIEEASKVSGSDERVWTLPREKRVEYWSERLRDIQEKDEPLNYAFQNTIVRLRDKLCEDPRIELLVFEG